MLRLQSYYCIPFWLVILLITCALPACTAVQPWQRGYLADEYMQLGRRPVEQFTEHVHAYREGSVGGGAGTSGGGCGCN